MKENKQYFLTYVKLKSDLGILISYFLGGLVLLVVVAYCAIKSMQNYVKKEMVEAEDEE